jgi:hypothetical protein
VGTRIRKRTFKNGDGPEGVDAYLSHVPPPVRALLGKLRKTIKSAPLERRSDVVSLAPTTSRFYYFVQLESEDGRPLALLLPLDTGAGAAGATPAAPGGRCPEGRNLFTLAVEQPTAPEAISEPGGPAAPTAEAAGADRPDAGATTR